jgi:hypothetical protein
LFEIFTKMGIFQLIGCCLGFVCLLSCGFYCGGCCCKNKITQDNLNKNDFDKVFMKFFLYCYFKIYLEVIILINK